MVLSLAEFFFLTVSDSSGISEATCALRRAVSRICVRYFESRVDSAFPTQQFGRDHFAVCHVRIRPRGHGSGRVQHGKIFEARGSGVISWLRTLWLGAAAIQARKMPFRQLLRSWRRYQVLFFYRRRCQKTICQFPTWSVQSGSSAASQSRQAIENVPCVAAMPIYQKTLIDVHHWINTSEPNLNINLILYWIYGSHLNYHHGIKDCFLIIHTILKNVEMKWTYV